MEFFYCLAVIIVAFMCVYTVVNRICECVEKCAQAKAYIKLKESENESGRNQA